MTQLAAQQGRRADKRFTPIGLDTLFTASARDFGPRPAARNLNPPGMDDNLIHTLGGLQYPRGVPFELGPADVDRKSWIVTSLQRRSWTTQGVAVPVGRAARFVCLAQFCDWERAEFDPSDAEDMESIGEVLAEAVLEYEDGAKHAFPIRRRFEVNPPAATWGRECFNAMQSNSWQEARMDAPLAKATDWGMQQQTIRYKSLSRTALWICALENPRPDMRIRTVRLAAKSEKHLVVCGLTLYHGLQNPLRLEKTRLYRVTLPESTAAEPGRWVAETDLGIVVRTFTGSEFRPAEWLTDGSAGLGERGRPARANELYVQMTSSSEAVLTVRDTKTGSSFDFDLANSQPQVEVLDAHKTWVRARVVDDSTGKPVPVRIGFRSKDGRYIPPYGHPQQINTGWFQDYSADVQVRQASFAYVDGTFQIELPVGDVYVEISKGFEYEATRERMQIAAGQRELELRVRRVADWRRDGWVTADTHVHFLSPSTALLEAQAEGLNMVNLLAAQWGDLYTNVGDLAHGSISSPDGETIVALGTENRHHLMGHLGLLGGHGEPVFPMSGDGGSEAYPGDPLWTSMSDWADACRKRDGVVVAVHFPNPNAELAAEIVRGKVDAVELYPRGDASFRSLAYHEWYRYLNCGYRVAAAGGTDKMWANTPVGGNRTYAWIQGREFSFANWAAAVRAGRTFTTTGPLLRFSVDGRTAGDEITMRAGDGTVEVRVEATSYVPFHQLEVVFNGKVVASREERQGTRQMALSERVTLKGPGWLAARCGSRVRAARFGVSAHTSPVYVVVPGEEAFSRAAAAYFLQLIEGTQTYVDNLATRPDPKQYERIRQVLREAHAQLHARQVKHSHA